ncbi:hypothetical protein ANANG_G00154180 [Anguilla anguilla]|uniref:Uncharacterized protein n=1 Tax=Anguilla anguilla TaxID=7936 RepID=A0A9D3RW23_ANGAN|nr:hypothetical protein ANANG_G00154180 [Anguilla anguilla]
MRVQTPPFSKRRNWIISALIFEFKNWITIRNLISECNAALEQDLVLANTFHREAQIFEPVSYRVLTGLHCSCSLLS